VDGRQRRTVRRCPRKRVVLARFSLSADAVELDEEDVAVDGVSPHPWRVVDLGAVFSRPPPVRPLRHLVAKADPTPDAAQVQANKVVLGRAGDGWPGGRSRRSSYRFARTRCRPRPPSCSPVDPTGCRLSEVAYAGVQPHQGGARGSNALEECYRAPVSRFLAAHSSLMAGRGSRTRR
jgi:hypothetical protein